jgi:hypothetical protein
MVLANNMIKLAHWFIHCIEGDKELLSIGGALLGCRKHNVFFHHLILFVLEFQSDCPLRTVSEDREDKIKSLYPILSRLELITKNTQTPNPYQNNTHTTNM